MKGTVFYNLPSNTNIYEDDYAYEVPGVEVDTLKLFSVTKNDVTIHYYFYKQHFGYTTGNSLDFTKIYSSESKIKIEFSHIKNNQYSLVFNHGDSFSEHYTIVKNLYIGEFA